MPQTAEERQEKINSYYNVYSKLARDIGQIPAVVNPARKEACRFDFQLFCETYLAAIFNLAWSEDHLRIIASIQKIVLDGGQQAIAMPRGSGKSKLCDAAALWATFYGHRKFVVMVGAAQAKAIERIESYKDSLENNPLLLEDFPEVCFPIRRLGRATNKAKAQTCCGKFTQIGWKDKAVRLPTVEGSPASGALVQVAGITGSLRGLNAQVDGISMRPDLVFVDDPQTNASASTPAQCLKRLGIINGDILKLGGSEKQIACFVPCTVIQKDDLSERLLDRDKNPVWRGERIKMMRSMPTDTALWDQYDQLRNTCLRNGGDVTPATEFYRANRAAMDAGADPTWPARYYEHQLSATQMAMDHYLSDAPSFFAEFQNEPMVEAAADAIDIQPATVTAKITTSKTLVRGMVPFGSTQITAYIDVQKPAMFYVILATQTNGDDEITGSHVVEYGTYPDQKRSMFALRDVAKGKNSLQTLYPHLGEEDQIARGLTDLTNSLCEREWKREDGPPGKIQRVMVDSGNWTDVIKKTCRNSKHKVLIIPAKGWGNDANFNTPMNDWNLKAGMRRGWNWRLDTIPERSITIGVNNWKTFVAARLLTEGVSGSLTIHAGTEASHRLLIDHLTAEYATPREVNGRVVNIWKKKPNRENHLFDCVVGSFVAASEQGALGVGHAKAPAKRKIKRPPPLQISW